MGAKAKTSKRELKDNEYALQIVRSALKADTRPSSEIEIEGLRVGRGSV